MRFEIVGVGVAGIMGNLTLTENTSAGAGAIEVSPRRRRDIQGLRAIAVVVVVLFHAGLGFPGGFTGVDAFFVISGFVITYMLMREHAGRARIDFVDFFVRRFKRLMPALVLVICATLVASSILQSPLGEQQVTSATALGALMLAANAVIFRATGGYFEPASEVNPLLHLWSLAVEEQFYIAFPFVLAFLLVIARQRWAGRRFVIICVSVLTGTSAALAMLAAGEAALPLHPFFTSYYSPVTRAWEFGVGVLVALVPALQIVRSRHIAALISLCGLGLLIVAVSAITSSSPFPGPMTVIPVIGTAMLLAGGSNSSNPVNALLGSKLLAALGNVSYSWYLWHWPAIVFSGIVWPEDPVAKAAAAMISLIPAIASYYWVEQPFRNVRSTPRVRFVQVAAMVSVPAVLLSGVLFLGSSKGWGIEKIQEIQAPHLGWSECMSFATMPNGPADNPSFEGCTWNAAANGKPVYLVGDSNATQFGSALLQASANVGGSLAMRTAGGCPFIDVYRQVGNSYTEVDRLCRNYYESTLIWLESQREGIVFIASTEGYWFEEDMLVGSSLADLKASGEERHTALDVGLTKTAAALREAGHEVVLVHPLPHPYFIGHTEFPSKCSVMSLARGDCELTVELAEIEKIQLPARSTLQWAASSTGAHVLDLRTSFCDKATCAMSREGELLYQDPLHITVASSESLAPNFTSILREILGSG